MSLKQSDIQARIAFLEKETERMEQDLKLKLSDAYENIKPLNILKRTIEKLSDSPPLKKGLLNIALNAGLGFLGSRLLWGPSTGIAKKAAGAVLQLGVANNLLKKATVWKNFAVNLFTKDKKVAH